MAQCQAQLARRCLACTGGAERGGARQVQLDERHADADAFAEALVVVGERRRRIGEEHVHAAAAHPVVGRRLGAAHHRRAIGEGEGELHLLAVELAAQPERRCPPRAERDALLELSERLLRPCLRAREVERRGGRVVTMWRGTR